MYEPTLLEIHIICLADINNCLGEENYTQRSYGHLKCHLQLGYRYCSGTQIFVLPIIESHRRTWGLNQPAHVHYGVL